LDTFLQPGLEILLPQSTEDVVTYLKDMDEREIRRIGRNAQDRVLAEHTSQVRAREFETCVSNKFGRAATRVHAGLSLASN
jgi:spore maturation protein CgeB